MKKQRSAKFHEHLYNRSWVVLWVRTDKT
jgi:hypothetical protein